MIKGNKGEWSELYAFVKLLEEGRLYAADENTNRIESVYSPILNIPRNEHGKQIEYEIDTETGNVVVHSYGEVENIITTDRVKSYGDYLYRKIIDGSNRAFSIDGIDDIMDDLKCSKITAPSTDKTDITLQIHDIYTGFSPVCGFSIKSELGSAPTLLNASGATNFVYEVEGLTLEQMDYINSINSRNKIMERMEEICSLGEIKYVGMKNEVFRYNLMLIDGCMEKIIADMLLHYYRGNENDCRSILQKVALDDPFDVLVPNFYKVKFKRFLYAVALGMMPSRMWSGRDEANGGYIIVKKNGDVVAYHTHNRNCFEDYLYNNTKFERGSTSRHDFAKLYIENSKMYINLNLQIRFK